MMVTTPPAAPTPATKTAAKRRTPVKSIDVSAPSTSAVDTIAAGTTLVHEVAIALIDPHPRNPRQSLGELGELAESIRAHGVQQPAKVVPHPEVAGRYLTVMGHRRIAAATMAGLYSVPAIVDEGLDETGQLEVMLVENLQRQDLTISEEGAGYQGLLDLGMNQATIVRRTGRAKATVASRVKIAGLPEPVRRYVDGHQLTIEEALTFGEWKDTHPDVWAEQLDKLENPHARVDQVFRNARQRVFEIERLAKEVVEQQRLGHKLIVTAGVIAPDDRTAVRALGLTRDTHAHCPGAELYIGRESWWLSTMYQARAMCADAEKYHPVEFAAMNAPDVESDEGRARRENRDREIAASQAFQAAGAARVAVAHRRRQWLVEALTLIGPEHAPAYAALADVAAMAAAIMLSKDRDSSSLLETFEPFWALNEDAVLPTNPLSLMTLTMLLAVDTNMPSDADSVDAQWESDDLMLLAAYLEACGKHGHVLDESETLLIRAAEFALDCQTKVPVDEGVADEAVDDEDPEFDDVPDDDVYDADADEVES